MVRREAHNLQYARSIRVPATMKAILEFNLPEDREEHFRAVKALDMAGCLWDIDQYLRTVYRYQETPDDIEKIREKFYEIMLEHGVNLEELYT